MAKRSRKPTQRATGRRSATDAADAPGEMAPGVEVAAAAPPVRRRVERVNQPGVAAARPAAAASTATATLAGVTGSRARPLRHQPAGYIEPLDGDDPAVPFDRVPYVPADLRRVAIIAFIMIALIIVADIIVNNVVK